MAAPTNCPDHERLEQFALGLLAGDLVDTVEAHIVECTACLERLASARPVADDLLLEQFRSLNQRAVNAELAGDLDRLMASIRPLILNPTPPIVETEVASGRVASHPAVVELMAHLGPPQQAGDLGTLGRFRLLSVLGVGGMGVVFRAIDPAIGRIVALKSPHSSMLLSRQMRERFFREGQAAGAIRHRNVVAAHEIGEAGELSYIASEYCAGPTLARWLNAQLNNVDPRAVARLGVMLADGVESAHRVGVLHRDIKPSNIILEPIESAASDKRLPLTSFEPRLTDFGLAKLDLPDVAETQAGVVLGTPGYMAPEQIDSTSGAPGPATDVYALGAVLYELLVRRPPFAAGSQTDLLRNVLLDVPRRPRSVRPDVPRDLEAIVLRCLEKSPRKRYPSAAMLGADLERFIAGESTIARPPTPPRRALQWCRRRPAIAGLCATVLVAITTLSVIFVFGQL